MRPGQLDWERPFVDATIVRAHARTHLSPTEHATAVAAGSNVNRDRAVQLLTEMAARKLRPSGD